MMNMVQGQFLPIWIFLTAVPVAVIGQQGAAKLMRSLLEDYDPDARPVRNQNHAVNVSFNIALRQIIDLDEKNQVVQAGYWYRMYWTDEFLQWNPEDHSNITEIGLGVDRIWKPDITHYAEVSEERIDIESIYKATIQHDGSITWLAPVIISSTCKLDVADFPWDTQTCRQQFGSWRYSMERLDLLNISDSGDITSFVDEGEWKLVGFPVDRNVDVYPTGSYVTLTFSIIIERRAIYYMYNIVLPTVFITLCGLLVFWLPPDNGEKISLSVTVLLASTVFMLVLSDMMPETTSTPIIVKYFLVTLAILVLDLIVTVLLLYAQFSGELKRPVPKSLEKVVLKGLATVLLLRRTVRRCLGDCDASLKVEPEETATKRGEVNGGYDINTDSGKDKGTSVALGDISKNDTQEAESNNDIHKTKWMLVVFVLDRLFFVLFLIAVIIINMAIVLPMTV